MDFKALTFTPDEGYWRIDWFGSLSYYDNYGQRRSRPQVEVFLSSLNDSPSKIDPYNIESSDYRNQRKVLVPVEYLTILRIGDIWHSGKYFCSPAYKKYTLYEGEWSADRAETVKASGQISQWNYLLPWRSHPYHRGATQTLCEKLVTSKGHVILIPSWVILQAYFSSCSYLLSQIFQFGMQLDQIYDPSKTSLDGSKGKLRLKKWVHDSAVSAVARIAWDEKARKSVTMVSNHLAIQAANNGYLTPKTTIPFAGSSRMLLKGRFIPQIAGSGERPLIFVAWEIMSCSSSPPVSELTFYRDNPGKNDGRAERDPKDFAENEERRLVARQKKGITGVEGLNLDTDKEASKDFLNKNLNVVRSADTPMFDSILVKKEYLPANDETDPAIQLIHPEEEVSVGNAGQGDGVPITFSEADENGESGGRFVFGFKICRLEIFQRVCQRIASSVKVRNFRFVSINPEALSPDQSQYSYFPPAYTVGGRERKWRWLSYRKGAFGSVAASIRRALVAEIQFPNKTVYLIEAERRVDEDGTGQGWVELDNVATLILSSNTRQFISEHELNRLLHLCSDQSGTWISRVKGSDIKIAEFDYKVIRHPENQTVSSPNSHDSEMIKYIQNTIGVIF